MKETMNRSARLFARLIVVLLITMVCLGSSNTLVFAGNGNGNGGGNGGGHGDGSGNGTGGDKPLVVTECTVEDGSEELPTDLEIQIDFNKNVSDLTVQENNEKAITLKDKDGKEPEYKVVFPEENEKRRIIFINASLKENTEYVLTVDKTLKARNGRDTLEKEYVCNFKTVQPVENENGKYVLIIAGVSVIILIAYGITSDKKRK